MRGTAKVDGTRESPVAEQRGHIGSRAGCGDSDRKLKIRLHAGHRNSKIGITTLPDRRHSILPAPVALRRWSDRSHYNAEVDTETRRAVAVFLALAAGVAAVAAWWTARQARAPQLVGVQVVYAWGEGGEASERPAPGPAEATATAYALVTFRRGEHGPLRRLCSHPRVRVNGEAIEVEPVSAWPASGGLLRGLWMTVEPDLPGWSDVGPGDAQRLQYKEFLAPELGRELQVEVEWRAYSDAFLARRLPGMALRAGPYRLKVRVAAYATEHDLVPAQWVSSAGAAEVLSEGVPAVIRDVAIAGVEARRAAPFFRLSCFTFAEGVWPDGGPGWPLATTPAELVARRLIVTPESFAAGLTGGDPLDPPWQTPRPVVARGDRFVAPTGEPLAWGEDVGRGDALRRGPAYFLLLEDDGDGVLSLADWVAFAWMQPGYTAPLGIALESAATELELLRLRGEKIPR